MTKKAPVRVIIVEDEALLRNIFKSVLETLGCKIVGEAGDGEEGINVFYQTLPDLVLLDIRMPGMDGLETLKALRERSPNAYVVMMSAVEDTQMIAACMAAGAKDYMTKTDVSNSVVPRLQHHIDLLAH